MHWCQNVEKLFELIVIFKVIKSKYLELILICNTLFNMLARIFTYMPLFSTAKYEIFKGKYLIPIAPKRPLTSYMLFGNDARKTLAVKEGQKTDVTSQAKIIAEKWKSITPEEKAKYEARANELRKQYDEENTKYQAKYVLPFKRVNFNNLITKEFYASNKVSSIVQGSQNLKKIRQELKEQELQKYKRIAEEQNKQNEKIIKQYEIPELQFKTFNSFLRNLQNAPKKSEMDEATLKKYEKKYDEYLEEQRLRLRAFANNFHIKVEDLAKLLRKAEDPVQIIAEQQEELKRKATDEIRKVDEDYKKAQQTMKVKKDQIKKENEKKLKKQVKVLEKNVEKLKKARLRVNAKYAGKLSEVKRKKVQATIQKATEKKIQKESNQSRKKATDTSTEGQTTNEVGTQTTNEVGTQTTTAIPQQ